jgi:hypothetical protein
MIIFQYGWLLLTVTEAAHDNDSSWGFLLSWEGGEYGAIADNKE